MAGGPARRNGAKTWLLSGVPRSGTSLCCRLTGSLPDTVALSEPIRRKAFGGMETPAGACKHIGEFALQVRARILAERRAPSVQVEGCLDDNRRAARHTEAGLRRLGGEWGEIAIEKALTPRFTLLVKHNALFAALLPRIADSFPVLALVRNPLAVLASWQTVDLPVNRGRLPAGEELDPTLRRALAQGSGGVAAAGHHPRLVLCALPRAPRFLEHPPVRGRGGERRPGPFPQARTRRCPSSGPREWRCGCSLGCGGGRCSLAGAAGAERRLDAFLPSFGV